VRDAFYASPKFPRLLKADAVKDTISRGLDAGTIAYVGKAKDGGYEPFVYKRSLAAADVEIADDVYLIDRERADEYLARKALPPAPLAPPAGGTTHGTSGLSSGGPLPWPGSPSPGSAKPQSDPPPG
jgi:hypothetical protein